MRAPAALAMVFKLVESAQACWRAVNAPHLVALVRAEPASNAATRCQPSAMAPDHGHGKRASISVMHVSRDVGPPSRRRS